MSENYKAQASYRFGTNQQSMLNLRAESIPELHVLAVEASEGELVTSLTHLDATLQAGTALVPVTSAAAPAAPPQQAQWSPPQQTAPSPAPQGAYQQTAAPTCPHGTRKFVTGVGAKGPWAAYFCPVAKGTPGACAPEWQKA